MKGNGKVDVAIQVDHPCSKCDCSWSLSPTNREINAGSTDNRLICVDLRATIKRVDGLYPQTVVAVRGNENLCGSKGNWWTPIKPVTFRDPTNLAAPDKVSRLQERFKRPVQYRGAPQVPEQEPSQVRKPRKPYQVG